MEWLPPQFKTYSDKATLPWRFTPPIGLLFFACFFRRALMSPKSHLHRNSVHKFAEQYGSSVCWLNNRQIFTTKIWGQKEKIHISAECNWTVNYFGGGPETVRWRNVQIQKLHANKKENSPQFNNKGWLKRLSARAHNRLQLKRQLGLEHSNAWTNKLGGIFTLFLQKLLIS